MRRYCAALAAVLALLPNPSSASGSKAEYQAIASKLAERALPKFAVKKIAVLPFAYVDGRTSTGGEVVADNLVDRFVNAGTVTVVDRDSLNQLLGELKLENSGVIDAATAQSLGKGLGVDAIVTGTLQDASDSSQVRVDARMIRTDTFEILGTASGKVAKTWQDAAPPPPPGSSAAPTAPEPEAEGEDDESETPSSITGFFDLLAGAGLSNMSVKFAASDPFSSIPGGSIGLPNLPSQFQSFEIDHAKTSASIPVGLRIGAFGSRFGGDYEFSIYKQSISAQSGLTGTLNGGTSVPGVSLPDGYLQVLVINLLGGDFFVRLPGGDNWFPYVGIGGAMSLDILSSSYVMGYGNSTGLSQPAIGWTGRIPFGVRFKLSDGLGAFAEGRYVYHFNGFDRGADESDSTTMSGFQFLGGISFLF